MSEKNTVSLLQWDVGSTEARAADEQVHNVIDRELSNPLDIACLSSVTDGTTLQSLEGERRLETVLSYGRHALPPSKRNSTENLLMYSRHLMDYREPALVLSESDSRARQLVGIVGSKCVCQVATIWPAGWEESLRIFHTKLSRTGSREQQRQEEEGLGVALMQAREIGHIAVVGNLGRAPQHSFIYDLETKLVNIDSLPMVDRPLNRQGPKVEDYIFVSGGLDAELKITSSNTSKHDILLATLREK